MDENLAMASDIVDAKEHEGEPYVITEDDIDACWPCYNIHYLANILNGEYDAMEARRDLLSLVGSVYDPRTKTEAE